MRIFRTALLALLATEAVAESSFIDQAIASGQLKPPKDTTRKSNGSYALAAASASGDSPDYHCAKDKPCDIGCCGPL